MVLKRSLAQLVDLILYFAITVSVFAMELKLGVTGVLPVIVALILIHIIYFAIQYPFYVVGQSVGKGFFRLQVTSTNPEIKITPKFLLVREVVFKVMSCYFVCLPALWKNECIHDRCCYTKVVSK